MSETLEKQERWKQQKEEADRQRMGGAYIQGFMETAKCASGCKPFGFGLARTPRECPSCHKQLILWVPGP